jgi:lipoic acid synthetase
VTIERRPAWLQKKMSPSAHADMERMLGELRLHTVCQQALCPNITECFRQGQATFLILGAACTRRCSFCNVSKETPLPPDPGEPERVAEAVLRLGLSHVVITSPTRDDLEDGGAEVYSSTVGAIRRASPKTRIELLVPDFLGKRKSVLRVLESGPDIFGHNLETVPRLYDIRHGAEYRRSLRVLAMAAEMAPGIPTKSGVMLGLGETQDEVRKVLIDLRGVGCAYVSLGQYLAPGRQHHPVAEFIAPETFDLLRGEALSMGFSHVESGPYVRSSYHASAYCEATK